MSDLSHSKSRLLGLSLLTLTVALAACSPQAGADVSPTLAALDSSESALLPPLPDVQPMQAGPAAPLRLAPAAAALPQGRTLGYASASGNDRYAWIDRANRINETIGDAPPDYGFDYQDGVQPYGWESAGGYRTYAEPVDGGYRTYYYDPGANEPYLVRDPSYSYGYSDGRLVTVYDRSGRALDELQARQRADYAARYYDRGRTMYAAAESRQRRGVTATRWANQREVIGTQRAEWNRTQQSTPEWRDYRTDHAVADQRLIDERIARAQAARQFSTWQAQGFRGQTPAMYDRPQGERRAGAGFDQRQADQRQADRRQADQRQAQLVEQQRQQQVAQQRAVQQQAIQQQQVRQREVAARQRDAAQRQDAAKRQATEQRQVVARQQVAAKQQIAARQQVVARQRAAAQQARQVQQRDAAAAAKSAQIRQQQANKARVEQQQRIVRERQAALKQAAEQQRTVIQHQREIDTAKRVSEARQNAANAAQVRKAGQQKAAKDRSAKDKEAKVRGPQNRATQDKPAKDKVRVWQRPGANEDPG